MKNDPRVTGLTRLFKAVIRPPAGLRRIILAISLGALCHTVFAVAVMAMIIAMFFGLTKGLGRVSWPWALFANAALVLQFPIIHSLLLTARGGRVLARLIPGPHGATLSTTTYAVVASLQLLALFVLWTPSGVIWWTAEGAAFWFICSAYIASWLLLMKASFDAGAEVQSGALGWMSLLARIRPIFPEMPTRGLFRFIRQPIYVAFAFTLWTVPVWTPDQLALALAYTGYCLLAPNFKERRFASRYGAYFLRYRQKVPYVIPFLAKQRARRNAQ